MKILTITRHWAWCLCFALLACFRTEAADWHTNPDSTAALWLEPVLRDTEKEFDALRRAHEAAIEPLIARLADVNQLLMSPTNRRADRGFELLWERIQLEDALRNIESEADLKKTKLRYQKGIEILKMLYEKVLSMDHHFTSLKAQQEMLKISNPHNYPEFKEARGVIEDKMKKKFDFSLPAVLQVNPYLSTAFSLVGLMLGGKDDKDKKADVEKIACIMDFTVRMNNDLNTVYYETGYLMDANMTLKRDCEALFTECTRQVGYTIPLEHCRNSDDWERLYALLDNVVSKATGETSGQPANNGYNAGAGGMGQTTADPRVAAKVENNLQFAIDRIMIFINRYSDFVNQGNEYYKKFAKITAGYENEKTCSAIMPEQFVQLKKDIGQTLDKFNSAYKMPEVQGSKLKDMMYSVE